MLKTRSLTADATRSAYVTPIAHGYRAEPELTLEFYSDGRRYHVRLTEAQVAQIARSAIRGWARTAPDFPTVFDIESTRNARLPDCPAQEAGACRRPGCDFHS